MQLMQKASAGNIYDTKCTGEHTAADGGRYVCGGMLRIALVCCLYKKVVVCEKRVGHIAVMF